MISPYPGHRRLVPGVKSTATKSFGGRKGEVGFGVGMVFSTIRYVQDCEFMLKIV